ncbi:hypothetical protein QBC35DRAFT_457655 [Podospora australis]|uniref:Uncharacterized protein n=1 Tax=Podospora australis TaxID=1536484 RepID=A0AAN6WL15_9PEZI|nr:hypothetical protein QBC35DRAFT_457655 [Podospora australis]
MLSDHWFGEIEILAAPSEAQLRLEARSPKHSVSNFDIQKDLDELLPTPKTSTSLATLDAMDRALIVMMTALFATVLVLLLYEGFHEMLSSTGILRSPAADYRPEKPGSLIIHF